MQHRLQVSDRKWNILCSYLLIRSPNAIGTSYTIATTDYLIDMNEVVFCGCLLYSEDDDVHQVEDVIKHTATENEACQRTISDGQPVMLGKYIDELNNDDDDDNDHVTLCMPCRWVTCHQARLRSTRM